MVHYTIGETMSWISYLIYLIVVAIIISTIALKITGQGKLLDCALGFCLSLPFLLSGLAIH